ncbi:MAG TPA: lytic transglycosylase domain-containing protein [Solirubrobacteraceae bacterium]|nr:lytic transglycosylase domain-containing protein [Solirubrobacteraceae bacterium]
MSVRPPAADNSPRRPWPPLPSPRRARVRRRRLLAGLAGAVAIGIAAAVWLPQVDHVVRRIVLPLHHQDIIRQQARSKHLDPALIAAVIFAESKFVDQTSSAGATGLMQITPDTARFIARRSGATRFTTADLATPQVNISYGAYYLRYLLDRYNGNAVKALAAYNGGIGNVDRWIATAGAAGKSFTPDRIPFPETRAYVRKVLNARRDYRANYARELGL